MVLCMTVSRCGAYICVDNRFRFLLGVNYWPRKLNIRMWRDWNEEYIREDCKKMKELGIRVVRMFIKDEDFADEDAKVFEDSLKKLVKTLDVFADNGIQVFITFIVGHMSGKNWRIPWTSFDEIYTPRSIEKTMRFIEDIVKRIKDHKAVAGWILSNELSLVKEASSREEALSLLRAFSYTVRSLDKDHVLSSGDIPTSYMQETYNVKDFVDYAGPHLYLYDSDPIRHAYLYAAAVELFSNAHTHPVIVEEFGFSTHQYSEESHAQFINEMLYTTLAHEASGAWIWCFSDFAHESDPPYEWRPLELGFGIIRGDGSEKKAADVVRRFSSELSRLEELEINVKFRRRIEAYVVAPFYIWRDYEFVRYKAMLGPFSIMKPLAVSYLLLSSSGISAGIVYELDVGVVEDRAKLIVLPSTLLALSSTWRKLLKLTERGVNIYASFIRGFGNVMALHESPTHLWAELFGVENTLTAGAIGRRIYGKMVLEFSKDLGTIKGGDRITIDIPTPIYVYRARAVDADVLAYDSYGEPIIFTARRGNAKVYLSLIPIETSLAMAEEVDWLSGIHKIYETIAIESGIRRPYVVSDPRVEVQTFEHREEDIVIAINHSYNKLDAILRSERIIKNIAKIGGDAQIVEWSSKDVKLRFDEKSAIILLINRPD